MYNKDTGLIRFGAWNYDPEVERWTSKDPILFEGGTSNLYEYALNDPVNIVDPEELKGGTRTGRWNLHKKPNGDIVIKPQSGKGSGEPTGLNIKDFY